MPRYTITHIPTGQQVSVDAEQEPQSEEEVKKLFQGAPPAPPIPTPTPSPSQPPPPASTVMQPPTPREQIPGFGPIMDLAGKLRSKDPAEAARLDRYAQGISTRNMPGFNPLVDIPMNLALATGYEGVKALPEAIGNPILAAAGYERKKSGQQTSPASLGSILALLQGMTR